MIAAIVTSTLLGAEVIEGSGRGAGGDGDGEGLNAGAGAGWGVVGIG